MKKQLLKESEVRKLMKFANIGALSDGFVGRIEEADMMNPEEEEGAPMDPGAGEVPDMGAGAEPEMDMEPEAEPEADLEMDAPEGEEGPGAEGVAPAVSEFVEAMDEFLQSVAGTPPGTVSAESEGGEAGDPMGAMEPEDEEAPDMGRGADEPAADPEEDDLEEDMINEVARRVARRLNRLRRR